MADDSRSNGRDDGSCVRASVALGRVLVLVVVFRSSGGDLVQDVLGMTRTINEWEAQRLLRIADLCEHECMIALPPSEAAQSAAQRRAAQLTALSQLDMTSKELGMALCISDYSARRLCRLAIALATRLSSTRTHLSHGDLDRARADIIHEYADPLAEHHYDRALAQKKSPDQAEHAARNICQALEAWCCRRGAG